MNEELTQIHLTSQRALKQVATYQALAAEAAAKGQPAPKMPALNFDGFSGRGVRLRRLSLTQKDAVSDAAAATIGPESTNVEYLGRRALEGAKKMVAEVTRKAGLATLDGADWMPVNDAMLAGLKGESDYTFESLFPPKDADVLKSLFRRWHDATEADVDIIEGKAVAVAAE